jgi:hypothetical protein
MDLRRDHSHSLTDTRLAPHTTGSGRSQIASLFILPISVFTSHCLTARFIDLRTVSHRMCRHRASINMQINYFGLAPSGARLPMHQPCHGAQLCLLLSIAQRTRPTLIHSLSRSPLLRVVRFTCARRVAEETWEQSCGMEWRDDQWQGLELCVAFNLCATLLLIYNWCSLGKMRTCSGRWHLLLYTSCFVWRLSSACFMVYGSWSRVLQYTKNIFLFFFCTLLCNFNWEQEKREKDCKKHCCILAFLFYYLPWKCSVLFKMRMA